MKEFKIFVDLEKEEKYLNQKASEGWILKGRTIFGRYRYEKGEPQQLYYKVDYRIFNEKDDFKNYVTLFEDSGFQHVWGTRYSGNQYFLPKTPEASREIFSDKASKAQRYKRFQHTFICSMSYDNTEVTLIGLPFSSVCYNHDSHCKKKANWNYKTSYIWNEIYHKANSFYENYISIILRE